MKKILFLLLASLAFSTFSFAQVAPNFDIYAFPSRFDEKSEAYFEANGFKSSNVEIMTQGNIVSSTDNTKIDPNNIKRFLDKYFPGTDNTGKVVLDWETGPYKTLRDYHVGDPEFKTAEAQLLELISTVKKLRPSMQVSFYSLPYRTWNTWQRNNYNSSGKFDNIMSHLDFITPSVYIMYTEEEVGRDRVLQYLRDNIEPALEYGKKFNKPVIPFFWHRVHFNSKLYGRQIMRKEVLGHYIKYVRNYSHNNYKVAGMTWWDDVSGRLNNLAGMDGYLNGTVYNAETYDAMIVSFAKYIKQELNSGTAPAPAPSPAPSQKVESYTLVNADTKKDIQTLTNGATLDLSSLPTKNLNIRANTNPATVGSVVFSLSGAATKSATESSASYDLMGDNGAWVPASGSYTLKATPYTASSGAGTAGTALSINFNVTTQAASAPNPSAVTLTLVNADTDKDIMTLANGATLDFSKLPTKNLNIRANTPSTGVGSVKFVLSGAESKSEVESIAPYALVGDNMKGDYYAWTPAVGSYTLQVTPYSASKASGTAGSTVTTSFKVVSSSSTTPEITLTLVNADTEKDIMELTDGATLDFSKLPTKNLNVRANTISSSVRSVVLQLSGAESMNRTESGAPYTLRGDNNGDYYSWTPSGGSYTLKASSYDASKGTGTLLNSISVSFKVVTSLSATSTSKLTADAALGSISSSLLVYPNPASSLLNVEFGDTGEGVATISLVDFNGNTVLSQEEQTSTSGFRTALDVSNLKRGLYILQVVTPKGRTSQRVVVE